MRIFEKLFWGFGIVIGFSLGIITLLSVFGITLSWETKGGNGISIQIVHFYDYIFK